jgi:hypothetical protein
MGAEMRMQSNLIDDRGAWWDAGAEAFRQVFHLDDVEGDIRPLLIGNMGFIGVSFRHRNAIIRFRPGAASDAALGSLLYWLSRQTFQRICLSFNLSGHQQRDEIFLSLRAALRRMEAVVDLARKSSRSRFVSRAGAPRDLQRSPYFSVVFDHWRTVDGCFDEDDYLPLLARHVDSRYFLFAPTSPGAHMDIVTAGKGLHIPDKSSHDGLTGSRLENFPDRMYGQWCARFYRDALAGGQPRFDHIHALIRWPRAGGVIRKYSRLILPCHTREGRPMLLGISGALAVPEFGVDARFG